MGHGAVVCNLVESWYDVEYCGEHVLRLDFGMVLSEARPLISLAVIVNAGYPSCHCKKASALLREELHDSKGKEICHKFPPREVI